MGGLQPEIDTAPEARFRERAEVSSNFELLVFSGKLRLKQVI